MGQGLPFYGVGPIVAMHAYPHEFAKYALRIIHGPEFFLLQFPDDPECRRLSHAANSVRASSRSEPPRRSRDMAPVSRAHALEARNSTHGARRTI